MEKKQERVLAYQLAKPLAQEDLEKVTGGVRSSKGSPSLQFSGSTLASADVSLDW